MLRHDHDADSMKLLDILVTAASFGITLFVSILVGVGIGRLIDNCFGTSPWGLIVFALLGAVSGFYSLLKKALALDKKKGSS